MDTLETKIAKVSAELGAFVADKQNKEQKYDYISADAVLTKAGSALARAGVVIYPSVISADIQAVERQGKSPRIDATIQFQMIVSDGEKNKELPWFGCGSDYSTPDKALYKAMTSGHKYFLMKLLNIGIGNDDSEHENNEQGDGAKSVKKSIDDGLVTVEAWEKWGKLIGRAQMVNIPFDEVKRNEVTLGQLRGIYQELLARVKDAEEQAKAGE
jgi:hypothetical protein